VAGGPICVVTYPMRRYSIPFLVGFVVACRHEPVVDVMPVETAHITDGDPPSDTAMPDSAPISEVLALVPCTGNIGHMVVIPVEVDLHDPPVLVGRYAEGWVRQQEARTGDAGDVEIVTSYPLNDQGQPMVACEWYDLPVIGGIPEWHGFAIRQWEAW